MHGQHLFPCQVKYEWELLHQENLLRDFGCTHTTSPCKSVIRKCEAIRKIHHSVLSVYVLRVESRVLIIVIFTSNKNLAAANLEYQAPDTLAFVAFVVYPL